MYGGAKAHDSCKPDSNSGSCCGPGCVPVESEKDNDRKTPFLPLLW